MKGPTCGAKAKSTGKPCLKPAGWRTDHPGEGRCKLHGGATPIKTTGRYSKVSSRRLAARIAEMEADPDPLNLKPEAALLRALVGDYLERFDEWKEALLTWNLAEYEEAEKSGARPRPAPIPNIEDAGSLAESVSRVVEKIHKIQTAQAVTMADVQVWFKAFGLIVAEEVQDADTLQRIEQRWGSILPGPGSGP